MKMPHYMTWPVSQYVALNVDCKCIPSKKFQILFSLFPQGKHIGQEKWIKQAVCENVSSDYQQLVLHVIGTLLLAVYNTL